METHGICSICRRIVKAGIRCVFCGALVAVVLVGHPGGPHIPQDPYQPAPQIQIVAVMTTSTSTSTGSSASG